MPTQDDVKAAAKRLADSLKKQGVRVAYGIIQVDGVLGIAILMPTEEGRDLIPPQFEGYAVNIDVTGPVRALTK